MILELRNIYKDYDQGKLTVPVLKDVSLSVEEGEYLAIMGPSGSGKTTLMNIIGCLDVPTSGEFYLEGEELSGQSDLRLSQVRLRSIGFVFQSFHLLPRQSAIENVALPLLYAGVKKKERLELAQKALERVGLGDRLDFKPTQLSGGQCQRVAIARAIVNDPKILLADEPTGALDTASGQQIMDLFQKLNDEGVTIVMITHEQEIAANAHRVLHIRDGRLVTGAVAGVPAIVPKNAVKPVTIDLGLDEDDEFEEISSVSEGNEIEIEDIPVFGTEDEDESPVQEPPVPEESAQPAAEEPTVPVSKAVPVEIESIFIEAPATTAPAKHVPEPAAETAPAAKETAAAPVRKNQHVISYALDDEAEPETQHSPEEETAAPGLTAEELAKELSAEQPILPEIEPLEIPVLEKIEIEEIPPMEPENFLDDEISALLDRGETPNYYFGDTMLREAGIEPAQDPDAPALVTRAEEDAPGQIAFDVWEKPAPAAVEEPSVEEKPAFEEEEPEALIEGAVSGDTVPEEDEEDEIPFDTAFDAVDAFEPKPAQGEFGAPMMTEVDLTAAFAAPPPPWGRPAAGGSDAHPRLIEVVDLFRKEDEQ